MCKTRLTSLRDYCIIKLLRAFTHVVKALITAPKIALWRTLSMHASSSRSMDISCPIWCSGMWIAVIGSSLSDSMTKVSRWYPAAMPVSFPCWSPASCLPTLWWWMFWARSGMRQLWHKGVLQEVIANQLLPPFLQPRELLQLTRPIRKIGSKKKGNRYGKDRRII